jgi:hypothetical protein
MSTILKALRRLEREKSAQEGRPLKDEVTAAPAAGSRRGFPLLALLIAAGALGLGLGASLLWLWPRENAAPQVAEVPEVAKAPQVAKAPPVAKPPRAPRRAGSVPAPPAPAAPALPAPAPVASVASAPPPPVAALAAPVAVVSRPEPPRAIEPAPPIPEKPEAMPAKPAPPERGSLPPFARRQAPAAAEPPPSAPVARVAKVARADVPSVLVSSTVWHPQRDRRLAVVTLEGGAARELHEGDAIGSLVVSEIGPSGVVFLHDGVELRRRVGAKN